MSTQKIRTIDSHIHLWPLETSNEDGHAWMTPGNPLAKPHLLEHYLHASRQTSDEDADVEVEGVIYVETDVRYEDPSSVADVEAWAKRPLDEIEFLRTIVDGEYGQLASEKLVAVIPWAPMNEDISVLRRYLDVVSSRSSPKTWERIRGFRYLLQFIKDPVEFEKTVFGDSFIGNLKELGRRGFIFEVAVDQRSGGTFQLEIMAQAMRKAHEGVSKEQQVTFILNHLCKPAFDGGKGEFEDWCKAVTSMSRIDKTYMKLSGAFSELPEGIGKDAREIARYMEPWLNHVLECFAPRNVMFGSDWPVCNVRGPNGEEGSWRAWKDVVRAVITDPSYGLDDKDRNQIWWKTAYDAYGLEKIVDVRRVVQDRPYVLDH